MNDMIQLQSILLPDTDICAVSQLYYHKTGSRIDFNGYFNLFYLEKRKKYTNLQSLSLCVRLQGYRELVLVHNGVDLQTIVLTPEQSQEYEIVFPYERYQEGCFWFALIKEERALQSHISGCYAGEIEQEKFRQVTICVDICTYKREDYVARNLRLLKERLFDKASLDVSKHIKIYVVDNGNTLKDCRPIQELSSLYADKLLVFSNKNAGGAGGFTRGMVEALKAKKEAGFTHILLMDDDAVIEPDALVRIYGFLTMLKETWKDMTIGGAMLREECPYLLYCAGEWWQNGEIQNPHMDLDLRKLDHAAGRPLTEAGHEYDRYSGWWCCCYSLEVVREDNLPVPLFLHHDDIEYGIRNRRNGIVFLNGIGVWHRGPGEVFPGSNIYYDTRNNLIEIALHQKRKKRRAAGKILFRGLTSAVIRLKYEDVDLVYRGFVDFLKGPGWLYHQNPESLHKEIRNMACRMYSLDELRKKLTDREYEDVARQIDEYIVERCAHTNVESRHWKKKFFILHLLGCNGCFLPFQGNEIKAIFPQCTPLDTFHRKKVVMYETEDRTYLLQRDYKKLLGILIIYIKMFFLLRKNFNTAVQKYENNFLEITNQKAWEVYLNLKA